QQLRTLLSQETVPRSPFLWPPGAGGFTSHRLSQVLVREFHRHLKIDISLADYWHVASALSRRHLRATHTSWTLSMMYTRPQNEAPGYLEARRWEYRVVSRGWHYLLGFLDDSTFTKRTPADSDPDDFQDN
ncbi:hypothetical protein FE257_008288, partial [Aspergillus nanangensis]